MGVSVGYGLILNLPLLPHPHPFLLKPNPGQELTIITGSAGGIGGRGANIMQQGIFCYHARSEDNLPTSPEESQLLFLV